MKSNNINKEVKAAHGIWTPYAKILCYECHGDTFPHCKYNPETDKFEDKVLDSEKFIKMSTPEAIEEGKAVTTCNNCNKPVQIYESVAFENNLVNILKEEGINAYMSQTGGMNSAAEILTKDDGFIWITYDVCGDNEWLVGIYDEEGDFSGEQYMTHDLDELLEYIRTLKDSLI